MKELIETEEEFGRDLQLVVERYLKPLDNPGISRSVRDNKEIIFTNLKQIADFHNTYVFTAYTDSKINQYNTVTQAHSSIHFIIQPVRHLMYFFPLIFTLFVDEGVKKY